jgi:hypothetical protein
LWAGVDVVDLFSFDDDSEFSVFAADSVPNFVATLEPISSLLAHLALHRELLTVPIAACHGHDLSCTIAALTKFTCSSATLSKQSLQGLALCHQLRGFVDPSHEALVFFIGILTSSRLLSLLLSRRSKMSLI